MRAMAERIGILVDRLTLRKALVGRPTYEQIHLYREIALETGIDIVVFSVDGIRVRADRVQGYVPTAQGWSRDRVPIPRVIHKRVLYHTGGPIRVLRQLQRRGKIFVNPVRMQNKIKMYNILSQSATVRPHIPPTWRLRWPILRKQINEGRSVILKPAIGSVGQGVLRITPVSAHHVQVTGRSVHVMHNALVCQRLRSSIRARNYLLQSYLNLARYNGRPFDLRVPVQRDGSGQWTLPGIVAKVAGRHPFLTNLAQGGLAVPGEVALNAVFSPARAAEILESINQLALQAAEAVAREYHFAADLGLDIGVDADGKPWLIEVNTRDQRITFSSAGLQEAYKTLYRNPIAYCAYLSEMMGRSAARQV